MLNLIKEYPYLYETHMHTKEASACGRAYGKDMANAYKAYGYTGIIITDHNWYGNTAINRTLEWSIWVEAFCKGYEHAYEEGQKIGLDVFFGYESCYQGTEFLIYGLDKEWLIEHPEIKDASIEEQYELVHKYNGLVIHAHPYREEGYIPEIRLYPEWVDGVEGINATHSNVRSTSHIGKEFDERAIAYAMQHNFPMTAGSDMHNTGLLGGGVAFRRKLTSIHDYISAIKSGEDYILSNGDHWFTKMGELII